MRTNKKTIILGILILVLFILSTYYSRSYLSFIKNNIPNNVLLNVSIFLILGIIDVITLPILLPFIPLAVDIYGFYIALLLIIVGWVIGVILAYFIARKYGNKILGKHASSESIEHLKKLIPDKNIFLFVVILRVFFPLDIGSYYLGTLSSINFKTYFVSSFFGILIIAVVLAYFGGLSVTYELIGLGIGISIILLVYFHMKNKKYS